MMTEREPGDGVSFIKMYFCVKECTDGTDRVKIQVQPIFKEGVGGTGTAVRQYLKLYMDAGKNAVEQRPESDIIATRKELREFMKTEEEKHHE
jgi:hypothetical protein